MIFGNWYDLSGPTYEEVTIMRYKLILFISICRRNCVAQTLTGIVRYSRVIIICSGSPTYLRLLLNSFTFIFFVLYDKICDQFVFESFLLAWYSFCNSPRCKYTSSHMKILFAYNLQIDPTINDYLQTRLKFQHRWSTRAAFKGLKHILWKINKCQSIFES